MSVTTFLQIVFDGLAIGLVYVFMAAGFNLILSVTNVFFIAFAMFYAIGAYFTWWFVKVLGMNFWPALIAATLITAIGGILVDVFVMRRIRRGEQPLLKALISSIMLATVLSQLVLIYFGTDPRGINPVFGGAWNVGGVLLSIDRVAMIGVSVVVLVALHLFLSRAKTGRGMRALAYSPEVSALHGVNAPWVGTATFAVGLGLAGFAGGLMAPIFGIDLSMGSAGFMVLLIIMLGGIGSMIGSIVSGIILGMVLSFAQNFLSAGVGQIVFFVIVALFFYFRPGGIFGGLVGDPPGEVASLMRGRNRLQGWPRRGAIVAACLVVITLPLFVTSSYWQYVLIQVIIYSVIAMTFTFGMRAGMINVCSAAFWGIGAYSTALLTTKLNVGFWVTLPLTLILSFVIALIVGIMISRFSAMLGMMLTIVFASIVPLVFSTFGFFGQSQGVTGIPLAGWIFESTRSYYYLALIFGAVAVAVMMAFNKAWTGRAWLSLASSPRLSQAIGVNPARYRLISFVVMSMIPAFMGTIYASYLGAVTPANFSAMSGVNFIMAAFVGGLSYFVLGSVVGSLIIVFLPELLRVTGSWQLIIVAVLVILIVMFMPRGLLGAADSLLSRRRPERHMKPALAPQEAEASATGDSVGMRAGE